MVLAVAAAAATALAGVPESEPTPEDERRERGSLLFRLHCAGCHGEDGRGDGKLAASLEVEPPDLTRMARRRQGTFPAEEVRRIIDGRAEAAGHGKRDMPVWGLSFQEPGRDSLQESEVRERIEDLVEFLHSLQEPPS